MQKYISLILSYHSKKTIKKKRREYYLLMHIMLYDFFYVWPKAHKISETGLAIRGGCGYSTNRKND
jgi:hypothetical protein